MFLRVLLLLHSAEILNFIILLTFVFSIISLLTQLPINYVNALNFLSINMINNSDFNSSPNNQTQYDLIRNFIRSQTSPNILNYTDNILLDRAVVSAKPGSEITITGVAIDKSGNPIPNQTMRYIPNLNSDFSNTFYKN